MMDSVTLGLTILIVLILLTICWGSDKKYATKSRCHKNTEGMTSNSDSDMPRAEWGQSLNDVKVQKQYENLDGILDDVGDYGEAMKYSSLEPEVFDSHKLYAQDIEGSHRGASAHSVRSDPNDIVNWVGLRRPDYHSVYAKKDARVVGSEYPDQMYKANKYTLY